MKSPVIKNRLALALRVATIASGSFLGLVLLLRANHDHYHESHQRHYASGGTAITDIAYAHVMPYDIAKFEQALARERRPVLLFFYTSWCTFCQKDFPLVNQVTLDHADQFATYVVSLDTDPAKFEQFIAGQSRIGFTPYNIPTQAGQQAIVDDLKRHGLTFDGGFPYFAVFIDGKAIGEVKGLLEKDTFDGMLSDVIRREQTLHPASLGRGQQQTYLTGTN